MGEHNEEKTLESAYTEALISVDVEGDFAKRFDDVIIFEMEILEAYSENGECLKDDVNK